MLTCWVSDRTQSTEGTFSTFKKSKVYLEEGENGEGWGEGSKRELEPLNESVYASFTLAMCQEHS